MHTRICSAIVTVCFGAIVGILLERHTPNRLELVAQAHAMTTVSGTTAPAPADVQDIATETVGEPKRCAPYYDMNRVREMFAKATREYSQLIAEFFSCHRRENMKTT